MQISKKWLNVPPLGYINPRVSPPSSAAHSFTKPWLFYKRQNTTLKKWILIYFTTWWTPSTCLSATTVSPRLFPSTTLRWLCRTSRLILLITNPAGAMEAFALRTPGGIRRTSPRSLLFLLDRGLFLRPPLPLFRPPHLINYLLHTPYRVFI